MELMNAITGEFSNGLPIHEAAAGLCRGLGLLSAKIGTLDSEQKIIETLDAMSQPSAEEMGMIEAVAPMVPVVLGTFLRHTFEEAVETMPTSKRGRKATSLADRSAICDSISVLSRSGCTLSAAKLRTAQKFNRTPRSVGRIWAERKHSHAPYSEDDLKKMLGEFLMNGAMSGSLSQSS